MDLGLEPAVLFVTLLIFTPILLWFCCIYLPTTPGNKSRSALAAIMKIHCDANFLCSERSPLTDVDKWTQPFTHGQVRTQNALRHVVIRTFHNFPSSSTHLFVLLAGPPTHGGRKKMTTCAFPDALVYSQSPASPLSQADLIIIVTPLQTVL